MRHITLQTPTGPFVVMQMDDGSVRTSWLDASVRRSLRASTPDPALRPDVVTRLKKYFAGRQAEFADIELAVSSPFQRRCWEACRRIPRGVTITYAQLAARAGSPRAFRAAGQAMRHNPMPIIVPCHRVVGSSGKLHGFGGSVNASGRELSIKRRLLQMEGEVADEQGPSGPAATRRRTHSPLRT